MSTNKSKNGMSISVTISELEGYEFFFDGKKITWEDMTREQQIKVLNSFADGYGLFKRFLKSE